MVDTARYKDFARDTVAASAARMGDGIDGGLQVAGNHSRVCRAAITLPLADDFRG